jgi:hypothetical protein
MDIVVMVRGLIAVNGRAVADIVNAVGFDVTGIN